jgi:hypothetical protein
MSPLTESKEIMPFRRILFVSQSEPAPMTALVFCPQDGLHFFYPTSINQLFWFQTNEFFFSNLTFK